MKCEIFYKSNDGLSKKQHSNEKALLNATMTKTFVLFFRHPLLFFILSNIMLLLPIIRVAANPGKLQSHRDKKKDPALYFLSSKIYVQIKSELDFVSFLKI